MPWALSFEIDRSEVRRYLGYQPGRSEDSEQASQAVEQAISLTSRVTCPQGVYRSFDLMAHPAGGLQVLGTGLVLVAPDLLELLRDSVRVSFLAVTLGSGLDQLIGDLLEQGRYAAAAISDAIGSAGAEQAMEQLQCLLEQQAVQCGFHLTRRFSPGYGNVPLQLQTDLAELLDTKQIGVSVTDSLMLVPQKSITSIIGWLPGAKKQMQPDSCQNCSVSSCRFRRGNPPKESR